MAMAPIKIMNPTKMIRQRMSFGRLKWWVWSIGRYLQQFIANHMIIDSPTAQYYVYTNPTYVQSVL